MPFQHCLAQELTDIIIDFLHDDKRTLRNCVLVCSSWARSAQYHLFYTHRLEPKSAQLGYAHELASTIQGPLREHVRELTLSIGRARAPSMVLTADTITDALLNLPRLRSLKLKETGFVGSVSSPPERRFELEKLSVSWMYPSTPGTFTSLTSLLGLFHTIRVLDLVAVHQKHLPDLELAQSDAQALRSGAPLRVHTVQFQGLSAPLLRAVHASVCGEYLDTVKASVTNLDDIVNLGNFLRKVGPGLSSLHLSFWMFWCTELADWNALSLSHCRNLTSVAIILANPGAELSWDIAFAILAVLPTSAHEITFVIRQTSWAQLAQWDKVKSALKRFADLRKVQFQLCTGDMFRPRPIDYETRQYIWKALPELKAAGVLW